MLPAITIGMLAIISYGVASSIWVQNIFIWLVGTVLGIVFLIRNKEKRSNKGDLIYSIVIVVLLVLPFGFNDLDGVHRWLTIWTHKSIYSKHDFAFINYPPMEIDIKQP